MLQNVCSQSNQKFRGQVTLSRPFSIYFKRSYKDSPWKRVSNFEVRCFNRFGATGSHNPMKIVTLARPSGGARNFCLRGLSPFPPFVPFLSFPFPPLHPLPSLRSRALTLPFPPLPSPPLPSLLSPPLPSPSSPSPFLIFLSPSPLEVGPLKSS